MRFGQTIAQVEVLEDAGTAGEGAPRKLRVTYSGGDVETYDQVVVAHGVRSDFGFIQDGSIEIDRAIVVDDFMRTSAPDVFAAGDAAGAFDVLLDLLAASTDAEERDALRLRLLDLFRVAGSSPEVSKARTRLAMLLM